MSCLSQLTHECKILRQLNNHTFGKIAVFDDGDELKITGILTSGRLLIYAGKNTSSYDISRIKYVKDDR